MGGLFLLGRDNLSKLLGSFWEKGAFGMDEEQRKAKRLAIILFLSCLCAALVCFGIFACIVVFQRGKVPVNERVVTASKIIVMTGIFFLVLAFGYLLPILFSHKKHKK